MFFDLNILHKFCQQIHENYIPYYFLKKVVRAFNSIFIKIIKIISTHNSQLPSFHT